MIPVRFTNLFRSVTVDLTEDAIERLGSGSHPTEILSDEQQKTITDAFTNKYNGMTSCWSDILAFRGDKGRDLDVVWVDRGPAPRYLTRKMNLAQ